MKGRRRSIAKKRALRKYQNSTDSILSFNQRELFYTGFNMGWRQGKKRQRQLLQDNYLKNIELSNCLGNISGSSLVFKVGIEFLNNFNKIINKDKIVFNKEKGSWGFK